MTNESTELWGAERIAAMPEKQKHSRLLFAILMENLHALERTGKQRGPRIETKPGPNGTTITLSEDEVTFPAKRQTAKEWRDVLAHCLPLFWPDGSVQIIEHRDFKKLKKANDPLRVPLGKRVSAENWSAIVRELVAIAVPKRKVTVTDSEGSVISENDSPVPLHDQLGFLDWMIMHWWAVQDE